MITVGYQSAEKGHCLREFVAPTKPCTLASDSKALALVIAPWCAFAMDLYHLARDDAAGWIAHMGIKQTYTKALQYFPGLKESEYRA